MNHPVCAITFAMLALITHLRADSGPWQICVELQAVSVATGAALELVPALRDTRQVETVVNDLQTKIARGEVTLIAWPVAWTTDGGRALAETIEEVRYPAEYDPPQWPRFGGSNSGPPYSLPACIPTAFETRETGVTLDATPTVTGDGQWIDLTLTSQHVTFVGFKHFKFGKMWGGGIGGGDQPDFFTTKTATQMHVHSGAWKLIGTFVVSKPEPHIELFLVRTTAHPLIK